MNLSTEQMHAVHAGLPGSQVIAWSLVARPSGPMALPDWIKGAKVEWMDGYGNAPGICLKVHGDVREWPDKRFTFEPKGHLYQARHPDGRLEQHAHSGPVSLTKLQAFRRADGTIAKHRRFGPEWGTEPGIGTINRDGIRSGYEPGEWTEAEFLATTRQEGYGGTIWWVTMEDGREIALRGPWHVGSPDGYQEFAYVDVAPGSMFHDHRKHGDKRPWYNSTGRAGLYLRGDVAIAIYATFLPHIELARVQYRWSGSKAYLEPLKPEWNAPKAIILERQTATNPLNLETA